MVQNIQFLLFAQMIPLRGWGDDDNTHKNYTIRTMKTQDLEEDRKIELKKLDDSIQREIS